MPDSTRFSMLAHAPLKMVSACSRSASVGAVLASDGFTFWGVVVGISSLLLAKSALIESPQEAQ